MRNCFFSLHDRDTQICLFIFLICSILMKAKQHDGCPDKMNKNVLYRIALLITNTP